MRKKKFALLMMSLMLSSCTSLDAKAGKKYAALSDTENRICTLGALGTRPEYKTNYMPLGFYGNAPQKGEVEIGNKAGDPYGKTLPDMYFSDIEAKSPASFLLGICFKNDPIKFSENKENLMLGLEMGIVDKDGRLIEKSTRKKARRLSDLFSDQEKYAMGTMSNDGFRTVETIFHRSKSIIIAFNLERGQKIRYVRYLYGDMPEEISNVSLVLAQVNEDDLVVLPYKGNSCSINDYSVNIGSDPVYNLNSQYGSVYSIDYLTHAFIAKDRYDGTESHPNIIEDPDDYFTKGCSAPLGTRFTVRFGSEDSQANRSYITFNFTIVDGKGPTISYLENQDIISSYHVDFNSDEFISKHFVVSDNYDEEVTTHLYLESGDDIPKNKTGVFSCVIEAVDSSGNITKDNFSLTLFDDVPPVISSTVDEVNLTPFSNYNQEKILGMFSAVDDIDGSTPLTVVEDTYSKSRDKVGDYVFTVSSVDRSGNKSTKSINIRVQDKEGPVFYAKKSFITASKDNIPTMETIISSLIRQEVIPDRNYIKWSILQGENIDKNLSLGIHEFALLLESDDNEAERVDLTLNIVDENEMKKDVAQKLSLWKRILLWFENLWKKIVAFFSK